MKTILFTILVALLSACGAGVDEPCDGVKKIPSEPSPPQAMVERCREGGQAQ